MPRKFKRLYDIGYFIFPFIELVSITVGYLLMKTTPDEFSNQHFIGMNLLIGGVVSIFTGWPLLFIRVNVFWWDVAYLVSGVAFFTYFLMGPKDMTALGLIAMFAGPGMVVAGFSYLFRRSIAFYLESRRMHSVSGVNGN